MAMPVATKAYNFDTNNSVNTGVLLTDRQTMILGVKNALKAAGWTVMGSSGYLGGAAWTCDANDNWDVVGAVVFAAEGANHAWIRLQNAALAGGTFELLLNCFSVNGAVGVSVSVSGFTVGGTTANAPTKADSTAICSDTTANGSWTTSAAQHYWHTAVSADLKCTRFFVTRGGKCTTFGCIEEMQNPVAGVLAADNWVVWYCPCLSAVTDKPTVALMSDVTTYGFSRVNATATAVKYSLTVEGSVDEPIVDTLTAANPRDGGASPLCPIGLLTTSSAANAYGRDGELFDMWFGRTNLITGSTYPGDGSKAFAQFGQLVIPWDGSAPSIS